MSRKEWQEKEEQRDKEDDEDNEDILAREGCNHRRDFNRP